MLHLDEIFCAEIYARDTATVHRNEAREGSLETMGFKRRFLSHFLFAVEKKVQTFPCQSLRHLLSQMPPYLPPLRLSFGQPPLPAGESLALYTREALVSAPTDST